MKSVAGLSKKAMLIILDGFGLREDSLKNAVAGANTPTLDHLFKNYPFTKINASGEMVGLPDGVMGNSEVGHLNLGAGKEVLQDLVKINRTIEENSLEKMEELLTLTKKAKASSKRIHLMGLLSDGGVHSDIGHIKSIITALSKESELEIFFHAFMDGRDTLQTRGNNYIEEMMKVDGFTFASIQGRFYAMDRDKRWDRVEQAYKTLTGVGNIEQTCPAEYIKNEYKKDIFDEFITPVLFQKEYAIKDDDAIFFINFRPDRAKELSLAFASKKFSEFKTSVTPSHFLCMTPYFSDEELSLPILFNKDKVRNGLAEYISKLGMKHLKIAETEKYAHVTYFFNGGEETPFPGEERVLIPSPKEVKTYDEKPQMSAPEVTERLLKELDNSSLDLFIVNFANCDMVGHTGTYEAAIKAVETVDHSIKQLVEKCAQLEIPILLTADHGNSDQMAYEDGAAHTAHTTSMVPACLIHPKLENSSFEISSDKLALKDIAPTLLHVMGIEQPKEFVGQSIFK